MTTTTTGSMLADVRTSVMALLDQYAAAQGVSPADDYDSTPRVHPMAEAKYMMACAELRAAGVLSERNFAQRVARSLARLRETAVRPEPEMLAWGLGFSTRGLPAAEPFGISTALVLAALVQCERLVADELGASCRELIDPAVRWLLDGLPRVVEDGVSWPQYSPGLPLVAYNAAAYWAGSLAQALPAGDPRLEDVTEVARAVLGRYLPGIGWTYESGSSRVDLIHTGYIALGLLAALPEQRAEIESAALCAMLQFSGREWSDNFDVCEIDDAVSGAVRVGKRIMRIAGGKMLVGFDRPARGWSLGELLVLLGELAKSPRLSAFALTQLRTLATEVVEGCLPEERFRHSMHLAHGLSCMLRAAREKSGPTAS